MRSGERVGQATGQLSKQFAKTDVGSDIQLFTNGGLFVVESNHVDGNLQCKSNNPKPTGGNNVVHGNKEDQCRDL